MVSDRSSEFNLSPKPYSLKPWQYGHISMLGVQCSFTLGKRSQVAELWAIVSSMGLQHCDDGLRAISSHQVPRRADEESRLSVIRNLVQNPAPSSSHYCKFWRMPMEDSYWEMMKSNIADMVNTGGRAGGSITASLFLKHFVDENIPWAHLDIAGPVWKDKMGGTGFAVATLLEWVVKHKSASSSS